MILIVDTSMSMCVVFTSNYQISLCFFEITFPNYALGFLETTMKTYAISAFGEHEALTYLLK